MKTFSSYIGFHRVQSALVKKPEVSTRAGCGGAIYSGTTWEASHIFYGFTRRAAGVPLLPYGSIPLKSPVKFSYPCVFLSVTKIGYRLIM